jgi:hypothetical protein
MSAKTKSERLRRLVSHGYFAPELPPCFVSEDLARYRRSILATIDALPPTRQGRPNHHAFVSEPAWFYFPRFGKEDRRHGVPNPLAHLLLSRAVADNYVDLRRKARASKITLSPPVLDWSGSRASITQQFNTTTSMGRLTLNVLLSFAQFERELIGERVRDRSQPPGRRACGWVARCRSRNRQILFHFGKRETSHAVP